jgi:sugar O-acyltransferase (sialic acid O-acetyltransferase NeuD family)
MYLYGAGGHAKVIIEILEASGVEIYGLFDDNPDIRAVLGYKVSCPINTEPVAGTPFIIAIGDNYLRKKIASRYPLNYGSAVHPSAVISPRATIREGSVVMGKAVINSGTVAGRHVILNTSSIIEHDCRLGDFVHISPGACLNGNVMVGEGTHVGSGAVVIPNISIGKWATIGAGAVIIDNVPDHSTVVGNPGRIIKRQMTQGKKHLIPGQDLSTGQQGE